MKKLFFLSLLIFALIGANDYVTHPNNSNNMELLASNSSKKPKGASKKSKSKSDKTKSAGKKSKSKTSDAKTVHVKSYTKKDGTRVKEHNRKKPIKK
jgi:uncharacterized protein YcfL